jgi:ribosomal protein L40E
MIEDTERNRINRLLKKRGYKLSRVRLLLAYLKLYPKVHFGNELAHYLRTKPKPIQRERKQPNILCISCGKPTPKTEHLCRHCGYDNVYALLLGLAKKEEQ